MEDISTKFNNMARKDYRNFYNFCIQILDDKEKEDFFSFFPEENDQFFLEAFQIQNPELSKDYLDLALSNFYLYKCIYILLLKAETLSLNFNELLAGIIYNVKFSMFLGEESIRDLANLCGLFAIKEAENVINTKVEFDKLDSTKQLAYLQLEENLDILNQNKDFYLKEINKQHIKKNKNKNKGKNKKNSKDDKGIQELIKHYNKYGSEGNN